MFLNQCSRHSFSAQEAAHQDQWTCPDCLGKLKRRKTKFTAASSPQQLRMAAGRQAHSSQGPLEDDQSNGRRRKKTSFPGDDFVEDGLPLKTSGKGMHPMHGEILQSLNLRFAST